MTGVRKQFLAIGECMLEFSPAEGGNWKLGFAGDTLNTAWYFRSLAPAHNWNVAYHTRLGTDRYSDEIIAFLESSQIDSSPITRDSERLPGLYLISVENGERSFTYWRGQSAARLLADDETQLGRSLSDADVIYFSGITLAILSPDRRRFLVESIRRARDAGKTVAFDPNIRQRLWEGQEVMRDAVMAAAGATTIILPSFDDERASFGDSCLDDCAARYLDAGAGEVVIKNSGGDMFVAGDSQRHVITGLKRVEPVDTTGAGDAFNGSYLFSRLAGATPKVAAERAHALASLVVRHRGALVPVE